jgi:hydroxymethylbilane synthase
VTAAAAVRDVIRVGTRGSALALAQTPQNAERRGKAAGADNEHGTLTTQGDTARASRQTRGGAGG